MTSVGPPLATSIAYSVASCALLWRRQGPLLVLSLIILALGIQAAIFGAPQGLGEFLPVVIAFFSIGRYRRMGHFFRGLILALAWLIFHEWRDPNYEFIGATVAFEILLISSGFVGLAIRVRANELQEMYRRAQQLESERLARDREAAIEERARIAHELHDVVGHNVSLMILQIVAAQAKLGNAAAESTQERLENLEVTARSTMAEMRRLVSILDEGENTDFQPPPGISDLASLITRVGESGVPVEFHMEGESQRIGSGLSLTVYRIVQEALTNVINHAKGFDLVEVTVKGGEKYLTVEVLDNGQLPSTDFAIGHGLTGMMTRALMYGGSIDAGPRQARGFRIMARIPLQESEQ